MSNYQNYNNGNNQQQQQGNGEFTRPFSVKIIDRPFHRDPANPNAPAVPGTLEECKMAVLLRPGDSGDNLSINYFTDKNNNPRLRLNFNLKIGQKEVADTFGPELVRPDNTVDFTVFMGGYDVQNMLEHTPRATQSILLLLTNMRINRRNDPNTGAERISVTANARGFQKTGSIRKKDGTEAKPMVVFGAENYRPQGQQGGYAAPQQGGYAAPQQGGYAAPQQNAGGYAPAPQQGGYAPAPQAPANNQWQEFDDSDDELPF